MAVLTQITSRSLADGSVSSAKIQDGAIAAADVGTNSITATELADDAVDTAALADGAVDADRLATNAVTTVKLASSAITKEKIAAEAIQVNPHIIPDVLYPAVAGKDLSGTALGGSYTYGTAHTDGRSYYYTDIKGSKPIKDPRIGSHFGSQRHSCTSYQLLEQETATHGAEVYSVDGREWMRRIGNNWSYSNGGDGIITNTGNSETTNSHFFEIVGFFNGANYKSYSGTVRDINVFIDGTQNPSSTFTGGTATAGSPLNGRFVSGQSLINITFTGLTAPAIHTLKIAVVNGDYLLINSIELIAQDTTSTATKSQIQIPSQNVVSYGKKFTVSGTPHYNPFATKGDGSASTIPNNTTGDSVATGWTGSTSAYWDSSLDTATSLGLAAWVEGGAYYRPVNGGRIVKWVDSTGTIKTSVNMMPPSAKAIGSHSGDATPTGATNWSTQYLPIFSTGAVDHSQAEVAKTFIYREFGNGGANGNASYKDISTMTAANDQNLAYVMDDGLTSLSSSSCYYEANGNGSFMPYNDNDYYYMTFIGTGLTLIHGSQGAGTYHIAQNLPYGTHILKVFRTSIDPTYTIDGVSLGQIDNDTYGGFSEASFHQPKMPPIPEDACILADYMLMADFVKQTDAESTQISKGVRYCNGSRDHFYGGAGAATALAHKSDTSPWAMTGGASPGSTNTGIFKLPFFGTTGLSLVEQSDQATGGHHSVKLNDAATTETALDNSAQSQGDMISIAESVALGQTSIETTLKTGSFHFFGHFVASPIHTSSHYQTFETPYLHELVGGDRNMEQNNLIVAPDGKSWDEVTRDTDYMGAQIHRVNSDTAITSTTAYAFFDEHRGVPSNSGGAMGWKNWVHAYDRQICLRNGTYKIYTQTIRNGATSYHGSIYLNGSAIVHGHSGNTDHDTITTGITRDFKRGDYIQIRGCRQADMLYSKFEIVRIEN